MSRKLPPSGQPPDHKSTYPSDSHYSTSPPSFGSGHRSAFTPHIPRSPSHSHTQPHSSHESPIHHSYHHHSDPPYVPYIWPPVAGPASVSPATSAAQPRPSIFRL